LELALQNALEKLVLELGLSGAISFAGKLTSDQVAELYRNANIVLNPSLEDNSPNSLIEALATATPIVTTNVGGIPDLVEHEKTALMVLPNSPEEMAAAIVRLVEDSDLSTKMVTNGLMLSEKFDRDVVVDGLLSRYQQEQEEASGKHA